MKSKLLSEIVIVLIIAVLVSSCSNNTPLSSEAEAKVVLVDSLNTSWNNVWNTKDANAIANMLTENTVVLSGSWKAIGKDSIMKNWVNRQLPRMTNFKTTKLVAEASSDMAFQTGFWTLDIKRNDSIVGTAQGNYTTVWKKQADNSWKIELLHMGDADK